MIDDLRVVERIEVKTKQGDGKTIATTCREVTNIYDKNGDLLYTVDPIHEIRLISHNQEIQELHNEIQNLKNYIFKLMKMEVDKEEFVKRFHVDEDLKTSIKEVNEDN